MKSANRPLLGLRFAALVFLLAGPLTINLAIAEGRVLLELQAGRDFHGQLQRVTYDRHGVAWIAAYRELFKVEHGTAKSVASSKYDDRLLALAPGGERFAWLDSGKASYGQFTIELLDTNRPDTPIVELRSAQLPHGFGSLLFSREGSLVVGVTALDDLEGLRGDFRYLLWSGDGKPLGSMTLDGPRTGIVDNRGESLVLLGETDAAAFHKDGTLLWKVKGKYRMGAVADGGTVAVLNPARRVKQVHVIRADSSKIIELPAAVYDVTITPDGSLAAVATGDGKVTIVSLLSCSAIGCDTKQLPPLPILSTHYITAVRFIDEDSVAIGVVQSIGAGPRVEFFGCAVIVLTTSGSLEFQISLPMSRPATWSPSLDVTFGNQVFAAYTPDTVIFATLVN